MRLLKEPWHDVGSSVTPRFNNIRRFIFVPVILILDFELAHTMNTWFASITCIVSFVIPILEISSSCNINKKKLNNCSPQHYYSALYYTVFLRHSHHPSLSHQVAHCSVSCSLLAFLVSIYVVAHFWRHIAHCSRYIFIPFTQPKVLSDCERAINEPTYFSVAMARPYWIILIKYILLFGWSFVHSFS